MKFICKFSNSHNLVGILFDYPSHLTLFAWILFLFRLIEEYKQKNILMKSGYKNLAPVTFSLFNKIIPQSTVAKHLAFSVFGYYLPPVFLDEEKKECMKAPINPFEPCKSKDEWNRSIKTLYPRDIYAEEFDAEKAAKNMLTATEIDNIYQASGEFADKATYITRKLKWTDTCIDSHLSFKHTLLWFYKNLLNKQFVKLEHNIESIWLKYKSETNKQTATVV